MVGSPAKEVRIALTFLTPAFIAGYDNRNSTEFRIASLKGLLRFWWRTFHGNKSPKDLFDGKGLSRL